MTHPTLKIFMNWRIDILTNKQRYHIDESGQLHARNLSAYWIPELTVTEKIHGTIYTVTGSYEGTESFMKKLERITAKNISRKAGESA